jgi:rare lipoprotein A
LTGALREKARACIIAALMAAVPSHAYARSVACSASYYGRHENGHRTADGEKFNENALTAASRWIPFGTVITVKHGNRSIRLRINDRGPAKWTHRCLDVTTRAARALGFVAQGTARVIITIPERTRNAFNAFFR